MTESGNPPGSDEPTEGGAQPPPPPGGEPAGWDPPPGAGPPPGYGFGGPPPAGGAPQYGQPPPQYGQPQYGQPPYGQPPPQYGGWQQPYGAPPLYAPEDNTKALASLILGIAGLVVCPVICSIIALVLGYQSRREIDASQGRQAGRGNATAGIILGWVGVGFGVLGVVFIVLVAIFAEDSSTYDEYDLGPRVALVVRGLAAAARLAL